MCSVLGSWRRPLVPKLGKTKRCCVVRRFVYSPKMPKNKVFLIHDAYVSYMEMIHPYREASAARPIVMAPSHPVVHMCGAARRSVRSAVRR